MRVLLLACAFLVSSHRTCAHDTLDRVQKLKDARSEAAKEIEEYKATKDAEFKKFESEVSERVNPIPVTALLVRDVAMRVEDRNGTDLDTTMQETRTLWFKGLTIDDESVLIGSHCPNPDAYD